MYSELFPELLFVLAACVLAQTIAVRLTDLWCDWYLRRQRRKLVHQAAETQRN